MIDPVRVMGIPTSGRVAFCADIEVVESFVKDQARSEAP